MENHQIIYYVTRLPDGQGREKKSFYSVLLTRIEENQKSNTVTNK